MTHANGSAHLRLANTDVLVGVKAELDLEMTGKTIEFFVDCSANATPDFEGRGGETLGECIFISNFSNVSYFLCRFRIFWNKLLKRKTRL